MLGLLRSLNCVPVISMKAEAGTANSQKGRGGPQPLCFCTTFLGYWMVSPKSNEPDGELRCNEEPDQTSKPESPAAPPPGSSVRHVPDATRGVELRHDHGRQYLTDYFQGQSGFHGFTPSSLALVFSRNSKLRHNRPKLLRVRFADQV